ncbi:MAG: alpha/beta hydrolase [Ruminococcaceae bacterium]|nr:alpha/beta hydrolase [Oscillospiraceae bacterium]
MKRFISIVLALILAFSMAVPAFAGIDRNQTRSQIPVVRISGDGEALYNAEGERIMHFRGLLEDNGDDEDSSAIYESIANVLLPFLVEGVLFDNWDPYYENLQKEISELFGDALLDCNGDPIPGTGLPQNVLNDMEYNRTHDKKGSKGYYAYNDYWFKYDWRLDPLKTADDFNDYIRCIKDKTGCDKVGIISSCLGTNVVTAYIAKYGTDDINGVTFDGGVCYGSEILSETISGKFKVDGYAIERILKDSAEYGFFDVGSFITSTVNLLSASGMLDAVVGVTKEHLYYKIIEGVTSALALSTFFTWPNYWAAVTTEDFDDALNYVFGEEGSEKRTEYAGLIEKIVEYDEVVRQHIPEIMKGIVDAEVNLGIMAKYGSQMIPVCESANLVSDQIASVYRASYGATTSTIYDTLSDEYIAAQQEAGLGRYISPDKQIDASTCMFPDYTWFYKGATHSNWTSYEIKILYDVATADKQLTVNDFEWGQFIVYDNDTDTAYKMTEDNCDTETWKDDKDVAGPQTPYEKLFTFIKSVINWLREFYKLISAKFPVTDKTA